MYKIANSILGFEDYKNIELIPFDDFFSTIVFEKENNICINIVKAQYLKNLTFNLESDVIECLELDDNSNYDIYFTVVMQEVPEDSIVNLGSPIIINKDKYLVGQFVSNNNELFELKKIKDLYKDFEITN